MPPKYQGFCFTHNNWAAEDEQELRKLFGQGYFRWICFGKEIAPSTGTPHLQGFMWLSDAKQLAVVKKKFKGSWVAVPGNNKGPEYWKAYCSKEDVDMTELGVQPSEDEFNAQTPKGQGKRTDLLDVKHKLDAGASCQDLQEDDEHFGTFVQHSKFFQSYQAAKRRRKGYSPPTVAVIHGPTQTMKSRRVWEIYDYDTSKLFKLAPDMQSSANIWWDGYAGHEAVLIEEFRPGYMKYNSLLDLLDAYPSKVQIKGGSVDWSPTHIYITSPVSPYEWYPNLTAKDNIDQLLRRITTITETTLDGED